MSKRLLLVLAAGARHALDHHGAVVVVRSTAGVVPGSRVLYQSCNLGDWHSKEVLS